MIKNTEKIASIHFGKSELNLNNFMNLVEKNVCHQRGLLHNTFSPSKISIIFFLAVKHGFLTEFF